MKVATERTILVHVGLPGRWSDPKDPFGEIAALVEAAGAEVVGASFVIDLPDLGGREKLSAMDVPVRTLISFKGG